MDRRDAGVLILFLFFFATLYLFRHYCGNVAPASDLSQLSDLPIGTNPLTTQ